MLFNVEVPFYFFLQTDFVSFIIYLVRGRQGLLSDVISQQQCSICTYLFVYLDMKMLCLHAKSYLKSLVLAETELLMPSYEKMHGLIPNGFIGAGDDCKVTGISLHTGLIMKLDSKWSIGFMKI